MFIKSCGIALALMSIMMGGAHAATDMLFTITAESGDDPTTTFELPASPTPTQFTTNFAFEVGDTPAIVGGSATILDGLSFYNSQGGGGLIDTTYFDLSGAQYYAGTEASPTFIPGIYTGQSNSYSGGVDTVTIALAPVPEPATWAMMFAGFAGLGLAGFRRARALQRQPDRRRPASA
jgi:PEP-CTERM motif